MLKILLRSNDNRQFIFVLVGYTIDNIDLQWHPTKPIVVEDLIMPQFTLEENEIYTTDFAAYYSQSKYVLSYCLLIGP